MQDKSEGFLASVVTLETGVGSSDCPWRLSVPPGQRINLTLHDFNVPLFSVNEVPVDVVGRHTNVRRRRSSYCLMYASISEKSVSRSAVVCGGETRLKVVYLSTTNAVDVTISTNRHPAKRAMFLIKYEGESRRFIATCTAINLTYCVYAIKNSICMHSIMLHYRYHHRHQHSHNFCHFSFHQRL